METFVLLEAVLYRFRDLLGSQNFALFCAYLPVRVARTQTGVWGVITCRGPHTVSEIYQASRCETQYWSLIKFLSRGKWDWQAVCLPAATPRGAGRWPVDLGHPVLPACALHADRSAPMGLHL